MFERRRFAGAGGGVGVRLRFVEEGGVSARAAGGGRGEGALMIWRMSMEECLGDMRRCGGG